MSSALVSASICSARPFTVPSSASSALSKSFRKGTTAFALIAPELVSAASTAASTFIFLISAACASSFALLSACNVSICCFIASTSPVEFFKVSSCPSLSRRSSSNFFFSLFTSSNLVFGMKPFSSSWEAASHFFAVSSSIPNFTNSSFFIFQYHPFFKNIIFSWFSPCSFELVLLHLQF